MLIKNGNVFLQDFRFHNTDVRIEGAKITEVGDGLDGADVCDAAGCYVVPGFVDIHTHGAVKHDFCEGSNEAFTAISSYLASQGVTSFLGTSLTYEGGALEHAFKTAKGFIESPREGCSAMVGINMEGPFINREKKGAQPEQFIQKPNRGFFDRLWDASGGNIKFCDLAPEMDGALELIDYVKTKTAVSIAHTQADYEQAKSAFEHGATHVTHLFNAMPAFTHRSPSVVGAASDFANEVELICDGYHVLPPVVRAMFKLFGPERICLISDALMACGVSDGIYELGGQTVHVEAGRATLENGTIAGSSTSLAECFRRAVSFGVPIEQALCAATATPARSIGMYDTIGGIEKGKRADIVILDKKLAARDIILRGEKL